MSCKVSVYRLFDSAGFHPTLKYFWSGVRERNLIRKGWLVKVLNPQTRSTNNDGNDYARDEYDDRDVMIHMS